MIFLNYLSYIILILIEKKYKFIIFYQINSFIIISQNKQSWTWNTYHQPEIRKSFFIFRVECSFLRRNFLNCLRDKAARDQVPYMTCNNEHVIFPSFSSSISTSNAQKTSNNSKTHNHSEKSSLNKKPSKTVLKSHNLSDYDRLHNHNLC